MSLIEKLLKNSTSKMTALMPESKVFGKKEMVQTRVPMINVALSGRLDGGLTPGLLMLAGPSKHFKTAFALLIAAAYQKKYDDAVILFYDSEFGSPQSYFDSFGIDTDRVVHTPITDVEQLKFDITKQLDGISKGDRVIIVIDSIGNLASKKEVDDAMEGKSVADMSRAKQIKSLFRIVTPHLNLKDIPLIAINHTYKSMSLFPTDVVSGGTGSYYSADAIWVLGRQQEKEGTEVIGYNFVINIEKSRHVREKSKIPISVSFEGGINKWSGMLDIAQESGYITKPKVGWYQPFDPATGQPVGDKMYRAKELENNSAFWLNLMANKNFQKWIEDRYTVGGKSLITDDAEKDVEEPETEQED